MNERGHAGLRELRPERHPVEVARDLLGWTLACRGTAGVLVEVEAYHQDEPAAHSFGGVPTPRTAHLFGPAGTLYVYFTYGMHWCANVVTGSEGSGEAVLFRAAVPVLGEELIRERRARKRQRDPASLRSAELLAGPARLVEGLGIVGGDSGVRIEIVAANDSADLLAAASDGVVLAYMPELARAAGVPAPLNQVDVLVGARIGISQATDLQWRFGVRGAPLSKPFPPAANPRK
ncbi:MAG: DNA-3-methyladenine glycosylase [Thermoleophilia bacterium]|nr:DNA-3-methyladenine glycosylase [Thermoleophilia bacterium]